MEHWHCECGGEMQCQSGITTGFRTDWLHQCDKCGNEDWDEKSYPRVEHKPRSVGE